MGRIAGQRKGEPYPEAKHASGGEDTIQSVGVVITFNHTNGLQKFNAVAVLGLPAGSKPWTSLDGDTTPSGEIAGVCGCWNLDDGTVNLVAIYSGAETSVDVPVRVFWAV